jgi:hypothetical protein
LDPQLGWRRARRHPTEAPNAAGTSHGRSRNQSRWLFAPVIGFTYLNVVAAFAACSEGEFADQQGDDEPDPGQQGDPGHVYPSQGLVQGAPR